MAAENINLLPYQEPHVNKLISILNKSHCALDQSPTGLGKTYTAVYLSLLSGLPLFVVCPAAAKETVWAEILMQYNVPVYDLISYEHLRGRKSKYVIKSEQYKNKFHTTAVMDEIIKKGALFVFDEAHKLKNSTAQNASVMTIGNAVKNNFYRHDAARGGKRTRMLFLSATIYDKPEHAYNIFKALGYQNEHKIITGKKILNNILNYYGEESVQGLNYKLSNNGEIAAGMKKLFNHISSTMIGRLETDLYLDKVFLDMSEEIVQDFMDTIEELNMLLVKTGTPQLKDITKCLIQIQLLKAQGMAEEAMKILDSNPNAKVILFCDYKSVMKKVTYLLEAYEPQLLVSELKSNERVDLISNFQEDNNDTRLIITSTGISGVGVSLHDIHGNRPRYVLLMPNFKATDIQQAFGRIYRYGSKSDAYVKILYGPSNSMINDLKQEADANIYGPGALEVRVMDNLHTKSSYIKEINKDQIKSGIKFSCDVQDPQARTPEEIAAELKLTRQALKQKERRGGAEEEFEDYDDLKDCDEEPQGPEGFMPKQQPRAVHLTPQEIRANALEKRLNAAKQQQQSKTLANSDISDSIEEVKKLIKNNEQRKQYISRQKAENNINILDEGKIDDILK